MVSQAAHGRRNALRISPDGLHAAVLTDAAIRLSGSSAWVDVPS